MHIHIHICMAKLEVKYSHTIVHCSNIYIDYEWPRVEITPVSINGWRCKNNVTNQQTILLPQERKDFWTCKYEFSEYEVKFYRHQGTDFIPFIWIGILKFKEPQSRIIIAGRGGEERNELLFNCFSIQLVKKAMWRWTTVIVVEGSHYPQRSQTAYWRTVKKVSFTLCLCSHNWDWWGRRLR